MLTNTLHHHRMRRNVIAIMSTAIMTVPLYLAGWLFLSAGFFHTDMPEPSRTPTLPAQSLETFMQASVQNDGTPHMVRAIKLDRPDRNRFPQHLVNISAQRGWYAFQETNGLTLIIPAKDIQRLEPALQDPVGWTMAQLQAPSVTPPVPDGDALVKVRVVPDSKATLRDTLYFLAATLSWSTGAILALAFTYASHGLIKDLRTPAQQRT